MNILLIDKAGFQLQTRKLLLSQELGDAQIDVASAIGDVMISYAPSKYQVVMIDHGIESGAECVKHILEANPAQQILVVSDAIRCIFSSCDDCLANYSARRLRNPTSIKNIARMISGFKQHKCDHYDAESVKI